MFEIKIRTNGSAFRDGVHLNVDGDFALDRRGYEVRRILLKIIDSIGDEYCGGRIYDINGNYVGDWYYE